MAVAGVIVERAMVSALWVEVTTKGRTTVGQVSEGMHMEAMGAWGNARDFTTDGRLGALTTVEEVNDTAGVRLLLGVRKHALGVDRLSRSTVGVASLLDFVAVIADLGLLGVAHGLDRVAMGVVLNVSWLWLVQVVLVLMGMATIVAMTTMAAIVSLVVSIAGLLVLLVLLVLPGSCSGACNEQGNGKHRFHNLFLILSVRMP